VSVEPDRPVPKALAGYRGEYIPREPQPMEALVIPLEGVRTPGTCLFCGRAFKTRDPMREFCNFSCARRALRKSR
jgi:hypothetical protein